jgi:hypothetical protein
MNRRGWCGPLVPPDQAIAPTENDLKATDLAATFINALNTIATGALVFSIGLVATAPAYDFWARIGLIGSWVAAAVSIIAGLAAQATIPLHVQNKVLIFYSRYFNWPARTQQIAFAIAMVLLAVVLARQLLSKPIAGSAGVPSAVQALDIAKHCVPHAAAGAVLKLELLPGDDSTALDQATWHVQLQRSAEPQTTVDLFVNAQSGAIATLQNVPIKKNCARAN